MNFFKKSQNLKLFLILAACVISILISIFIIFFGKGTSDKNKAKSLGRSRVEFAKTDVNPKKIWEEHFEGKLDEQIDVQQKSKIDIEESLKKQQELNQSKTNQELSVLRQEIFFLQDELRELTQALNTKNELTQVQIERSRNLKSNIPKSLEDFDKPKSADSYIPETSYISGILLGGLSISTGLSSSTEPVPVVISITDKGSIPKTFKQDLTMCKILGSAYGDLSSERAVIRAEVLSCIDENNMIRTTKIAGIIYGDDGANGIKGSIVRTNASQLQNAFIGSMISGFSSSAKGISPMTLSSGGLMQTQKQSPLDLMQDGGLNGISNAGDKLADYYLRQAEQMSPVLKIPPGVRVDILFTKGVYFGSKNIKSELNTERLAQKVQHSGGSYD